MAGMKTRQRKRQQARRALSSQKTVETFESTAFDPNANMRVEALVAGAVAVHHTAVVSGTWDGNVAMGKCSSAADFRSICAAYNSGTDLSQRQNWHLPHHDNPNGPANISGVRNGLSRAPQTSSISPADRAGATAHLRAHLNDYNKKQGNNAIAGFDALSDEDALAAFDRHFAVEEELAPALPSGVSSCSLRGRPGYTGGGLCYTHDGSDAGKQKAMDSAERDAKKKGMAMIAAARPIAFSGVATVEGKVSDDNSIAPRVILPNALSWPEMPLSFMAQTQTAEGHDGAEVAGRIDEFARKKGMGKTYNINFSGELTTPFGITEIAPMLEDKTMRYVSADLGASEWNLVDRKTLDVVPQDEFDIAKAMDGAYALGCASAKMKAVTLVPTQAIEGAMVALTASADEQGIGVDDFGPEALLSCATSGSWSPDTDVVIRVVIPVDALELGGEALVAAAAPVAPPRSWFETQEPPGKMPLTILEDGRVYGHLATWDSCHVSFLPSCVPPPRSTSNYAYFHVSELDTEDGATLTVGKLMFSPTDGGHADRGLTAQKASQYYDRTGMVAAYLRVIDGKFGIWACGSVNPRLTDAQRKEMRREMRLHPPSGDWRPINGQYELICGLAVAVPGFPVPRASAKVTVVASAEGVEMQDALIASSGWFDADPAALAALGLVDEEAEAERQIKVLAARAAGGLDALAALVE